MMICGKCGQIIEDLALCCPNCGWKVPEPPKEQPEPEPIQPVEPELLQPVEPEPLQPVEPEVLQPVEPEPPRPEPEPWIPQRKKRNKGMIVLAFALGVIAVLLGAFALSRFLYFNSDGFKLAQAAQAMIEGDVDAGLDLISGIRSPEAEATREYADLLKRRSTFAAEFDPSQLQNADDPVKIPYDKLMEAYILFTDGDKLPDELKSQYNGYKAKLMSMNQAMSAVSLTEWENAQSGVLFFGERKRGQSFTVGELESVVGVTKHAERKLRTKITEAESFRAFASHSPTAAAGAVDELEQIVFAQLKQDEYDLESYSDMDLDGRSVTLKDVDPDYQASVGELLLPLNSSADAKENASHLYTALSYAWAAYAFDIY